MAVLSVSDGELRRLEVLRDVDRGGLPVRAAAQLLGRSDRQVWRLLKGFRAAGAAGVGLQETRAAEQPADGSGGARGGAVDGASELCRFRANLGRRKARRRARLFVL